MLTIGRWGLRVPEGTDGPPNVPLRMQQLATDLSDVAKDNQGTLAARPTSTTLTPGISGRYFTTTDEDDPAGTDRRRVYRDAGTAWDELATVPVSRRQLDAAITAGVPSGVLTPAQFLAMGATADDTVVRVLADSARGVVWTLLKRSTMTSARKWAVIGGGPALRVRQAGSTTVAAAAGAYTAALAGTAVLVPLGGLYVAKWGYQGFGGVAAQQLTVSVFSEGVVVGDADAFQGQDNGDASAQYTNVHSSEEVTPNANVSLDLRARRSIAAGTSVVRFPWLELWPVSLTGP